ncbi:MAG: hypothetical protein J5950_00765 [Clostridia bacterium]|nr:hypothetical protein [Clostridia bacterium]
MNRIPARIFAVLICAVSICCFASCKSSSNITAVSPAPDSEPYVPRTEQNRKIDMIMWYDCDGWVSSMELGDNRAERPQQACRVSDTYMGKYSSLSEKTALQHAYWIYSLGCNAICCDWTNYISYRQRGSDFSYNKRIYSNTEKMLKTLKNIEAFSAPALYVAIRLSDFKYEELQMKLDDVYALYENYKDEWYYFDDGTENALKPFVVIFTDVFYTGSKWYDRLHNTWHEGEELSFYEDSRFNIRWSNGYLGVTAQEDEKGRLRIGENQPYWTFVEPYTDKKAGKGYYEVMYNVGKNGEVEQMSCWASMYADNSYWDPLNNIIDGKTTFERTIRCVSELMPKALLINRFNYPLAWPEEPQEGLSLFESTHIEPNYDFGFSVFDNVKQNLYELNGWEKSAPPAPACTISDGSGKILAALKSGSAKVFLSLEGEPQMYRMSVSPDMTDAGYVYYDLTEGIILPEELKDFDGTVYLQTQNAFGDSSVVSIGQ